MKASQISGPALIDALVKAGKLTADQKAAAAAGKLKALRAEFYHRAKIANSGNLNGVAVLDVNAIPSFGLTNLNQGGKLPVDFLIIGTRAAIAVVADAAELTAADIKAASYDNLVLNLGATTKRIPDLIKNSFFRLEANGKTEAEFAAKNYFLQGNSKQYIESADDDLVLMPDGLKVYAKDTELRPTLLMPENVQLSATATGNGSKQYVWETTYVGFKLVIEA